MRIAAYLRGIAIYFRVIASYFESACEFSIHFDEFFWPFLKDFGDRDKEQRLICTVRAVRMYMSRTD